METLMLLNMGKNKTKIINFVTFFFIQMINYGLLCVSYRAISLTNYWILGSVDFLIASLNFFVIKKIANEEENSTWQWFGYASGGVIGSILGTYLSAYFGN